MGTMVLKTVKSRKWQKEKLKKKYNNIFGQFKYKEEKKSNGHVTFAVAHCDICCFFFSKGAHGEKKL